MFYFSRKYGEIPRTSEEESAETLLSHDRQAQQNETATLKECGCSTAMNPPSSSGDTLASWGVVICLLCTVISLALSFDTPNRGSVPPMDQLLRFDRKKYNSLNRPSPFIGLDKIIRPEKTERSILNYPQAIMQVDAANPKMVFDDDPKRYMSKTGFVSPEDRRVKISKSISTVIDFRAIDFGMELCELKLLLPANVTASSRGLPNETFSIAVHRLDTDQPIDTKTLSYSTRPPRLHSIANIKVTSGKPVDFSHTFHCLWDASLAFEFSCFGDDRSGFHDGDRCSVEWWQNKDSDSPGMAVFMKQHSTV